MKPEDLTLRDWEDLASSLEASRTLSASLVQQAAQANDPARYASAGRLYREADRLLEKIQGIIWAWEKDKTLSVRELK